MEIEVKMTREEVAQACVDWIEANYSLSVVAGTAQIVTDEGADVVFKAKAE